MAFFIKKPIMNFRGVAPDAMKNLRNSSVLMIPLTYLVLGVLWILLSDRVVALLFEDPKILSIAQTYKGSFFIIITAGILYIFAKITRNAQKVSEQNFSELFESTTAGIFQSSPDGRFIKVNTAMASIYGYTSPREMLEKINDISTQILASPESRKKFTELLNNASSIEKFEAKNIKKDGSIIWTSTNARIVKDQNGNILYYEGFVTDITEQKNIEIALRESEAQYRMVVEQASDGIIVADRSGKIFEANQKICNMLGFSRAELLNLSLDEMLANEGARPWMSNEFTRGRNVVTETALKRKDGTLLLTELSMKSLPNKMTIGIARNISSRKLMEESLARSEKKFRALIENSTDAIALYTADGKIIFQSPAATRILGYTLDEMIGKKAFEFVYKEDKEKTRTALQKIIKDPMESISIEIRCVCKDGSLKWVEVNGKNHLNDTGIEAIVTNYRDITGRKNLENAMRETEEQYRLLVEKLPTVVFMDMFGDAQVTQYISPRIKDLLGYTPDEWNSTENIWENSLHSDDRERVLAEDIRTDKTKEPFRIEYRMRHRDGHYVWIKEDASIITGEDGIPLYWHGILSDITEQKRAEEAQQKQFRELSVLHSAALATSTATDTDKMIQQITNIIGDMLYSDNCGVLLLNEKQDMLEPHFSYRGTDIGNIGASLPVTKGVSGRVISTRRAIRVGDVSLEPSYFEVTSQTRSELCVPIISGSKIFGVLNVESKRVDTFTKRDERLLNTIAAGMANAMERIQLYELEKKRRQEAEILREATTTLTSFIELDKLFENIFISLEKLISFDSASIELVRQENYEIVAGKNIPKELIGKKYPRNIEKWGDIELLRMPVIIPNTLEDERFEKFEQTNYIRGWMGIPLLVMDKLIGFLNLDSRTTDFFNQEHAAIAQTFANQAAIAIENVSLFELEKRRRKGAEDLSLATSSLANTLEVDDLFENILDWLKKIVVYDSASIMLNQGDALKLVAKRNLPEQFHLGDVFPMTEKWRNIAEDRSPLIIEDIQKDAPFEKWEGSEYIRAWMAVAIFAQDSLIGFINLDSRTAGTYTKEHATLIQTFANQVATAIEQARYFELEKKRRKEAETVMQATTALTNLLDLPSLHNAILEWLYKIAPYDSASILEIEGGNVRITAAKGLPDPEKVLNQTFSSKNVLCKIINETGQTLIIDDCKDDARFEKWGNAQHVRGWMGVPLISRGQVIGYLTVDSRTPNAFTQSDAIAAQTFAHQAATSLENTRLYTETRQRLEELEMVNRVSFALRAAKDTNEMLPILLNELKTSIETDAAAILLYDPEQDLITPRATSGWLRDLPQKTFKLNEGIIGKVFSSGDSYTSAELVEDQIAVSENEKLFGKGRVFIAVPIRTANETIGVIMIAIQKPQKIEEHHTRLIATLAEIAGNAIHRSSLFEQSEEQIRRLTTLREMDTAITSSLDLHVTLGILAEHLSTKMGVSAARILVFNPNSQMLECYTANGFNNQSIPRIPIGIGEELASQILLNRKELYIQDVEREKPDFNPVILSAEGFKSYYALPLFSKGATRGILETYFRYPFTPTTEWMDFLKTLAGQATIAIDNTQLFENLQRTNQELSLAYDTTLEGWGKALELRDKETQGHTRRVTNLTLELARQMGIPESELPHIRRGALLHDIGKMGVPDNILHKAGSLSKEETNEMRRHPQYAYDLLSPIPYLRSTLDIAYCHHEWWDGNGYPRGLKGEEIPLPARIFAIVDVWDALLSDRPYRQAWRKEEIMQYIIDLSGKQFDPRIVEKFKKMIGSETKFIQSNLPKKIQRVIKKQPEKQKKAIDKTKKMR
jgi:PAS domain S-box-containing protein